MAAQRSSADRHAQDTTLTKVFVGGLAWETERDTMHRHFVQYDDIVEAVVISDKITGRSKGYGFVTFREPEAARRACADATPIIDGRRTNCNLASLGAHHRARSAFSVMHGNRFRAMAPVPGTSPHPGEAMYMNIPAYFQQQGNYAYQYAFPYQSYGYIYPPEFLYQQGPYTPYCGLQYPQFHPTLGGTGNSAMYPYMHYSQPWSQSFSAHMPQVMQYDAAGTMTDIPAQSHGVAPLSTSTSSAVQQERFSHIPNSE